MTIQLHNLLVDQSSPAKSEYLTQAGKAFRVRTGRTTCEWAVFRCRCGHAEVYRLKFVRNGRIVSCGCKRSAGLQAHYQSDYQIMRMRHQHGIPVEPDWCSGDEIFSTDAIIRDCGRNPGGMLLTMVDHDQGYIAGNVVWSWYETAERQQQTMALHRMAANGMRWCPLWAMENERIDRAKRKKINAFPVKGEILSDCLICGAATPKCKVQRRLIRRYRCDACCREYIVRRPMQ